MIENFRKYLSVISIHDIANTLWYFKKPLWLFYLLLPLSFIFNYIILFRKYLYQKNIFKITRFNIPIIIVGNITIGGTGKTPLIIYLAEYFIKKNSRVGIVSRGYGGRKNHKLTLVSPNDSAKDVGDEALLLSQRLNCPVMICKDRVAAVSALLKTQHCDVILSDDGLQHYKLGRTLEIAVINQTQGFGNGYCLPAGPLREPIERLNTVDFVIGNINIDLEWKLFESNPSFSERDYTIKNSTRAEGWRSGEVSAARSEALLREYGGAPQRQDPSKLMLSKRYDAIMRVIPQEFISVKDFHSIIPLDLLNSKKNIYAIAGIGTPEGFFNTLRKMGLTIIPKAFPDHYEYNDHNINFGEEAVVIMTEKDAVKCRAFAKEGIHWFLRVGIEINPVSFAENIYQKVRRA